ncbi:hypothetical protein [Micromonospora sp. NBC_00421]|uniref:hypothetical protein n=1 Tax=Micromonospora sp. NBC_00421 TaxID=2975976 RepID=UPI002E232FB9
MMDPTFTTGVPHAARAGALILASLLMVTGCSGTIEPGRSGSDGTPPRPSPAAMRLDKPTKVLGTWNESLDRRLTQVAQSNMGELKRLLDGEPLSALGTAYIPVKEEHSAELGLYRPGDERVVLLSGVSGTVADPERTLDLVFTRLTAITGVTPVPPGPIGGSARCGEGQSSGARVDVCAWADRHTLGMVHLFRFPQTAHPEETLR